MQSSVVVVVKPINHFIHCLTAYFKSHSIHPPAFNDPPYRLLMEASQQFPFLLIELCMPYSASSSEMRDCNTGWIQPVVAARLIMEVLGLHYIEIRNLLDFAKVSHGNKL